MVINDTKMNVGSLDSAMKLRSKKVEMAFNTHSQVLCWRFSSLKSRFEERSKRVLPVLLHGGGG